MIYGLRLAPSSLPITTLKVSCCPMNLTHTLSYLIGLCKELRAFHLDHHYEFERETPVVGFDTRWFALSNDILRVVLEDQSASLKTLTLRHHEEVHDGADLTSRIGAGSANWDFRSFEALTEVAVPLFSLLHAGSSYESLQPNVQVLQIECEPSAVMNNVITEAATLGYVQDCFNIILKRYPTLKRIIYWIMVDLCKLDILCKEYPDCTHPRKCRRPGYDNHRPAYTLYAHCKAMAERENNKMLLYEWPEWNITPLAQAFKPMEW